MAVPSHLLCFRDWVFLFLNWGMVSQVAGGAEGGPLIDASSHLWQFRGCKARIKKGGGGPKNHHHKQTGGPPDSRPTTERPRVISGGILPPTGGKWHQGHGYEWNQRHWLGSRLHTAFKHASLESWKAAVCVSRRRPQGLTQGGLCWGVRWLIGACQLVHICGTETKISSYPTKKQHLGVCLWRAAKGNLTTHPIDGGHPVYASTGGGISPGDRLAVAIWLPNFCPGFMFPTKTGDAVSGEKRRLLNRTRQGGGTPGSLRGSVSAHPWDSGSQILHHPPRARLLKTTKRGAKTAFRVASHNCFPTGMTTCLPQKGHRGPSLQKAPTRLPSSPLGRGGGRPFSKGWAAGTRINWGGHLTTVFVDLSLHFRAKP